MATSDGLPGCAATSEPVGFDLTGPARLSDEGCRLVRQIAEGIAISRVFSGVEDQLSLVRDTRAQSRGQARPSSVDRPLLDLGCGVGEPALTAARRWPAVIGLDQDEQALQTARQRAQAQGLDNAEFREGFEHLGLQDASAAAAISRFGLLMLGDGEAEFPDTDGAIDYLLEAGGPFTGFYAALSDQLDEVRAVQRELIREQETRSASAVTLRSSCRIFSGARRPGMSTTLDRMPSRFE
jgi:SAM-dependent methyltransferase